MTEPKILVLVLAINQDPWTSIEVNGQNPTWKRSRPDNMRILRYIGAEPQSALWKLRNKFWSLSKKVQDFSGGRFSVFSINSAVNRRKIQTSRVDLERCEIVTTVPDLYSLIGAKTLDAFSASLREFEFDYIFRTNVSSYLNLVELKRFIEDKPRENFYAGNIGNYQGISFASGCGYFISRDLVIRTLQNRFLWDHNLIDDVSLGKLITEDFQIDIFEVQLIHIDSLELIPEQVRQNPSSVFHYRCKASDQNTTIQIMKSLHKILSND